MDINGHRLEHRNESVSILWVKLREIYFESGKSIHLQSPEVKFFLPNIDC